MTMGFVCQQSGQQFFRPPFLKMGPVHFVVVVACALLCAKYFASSFNEAVLIVPMGHGKCASSAVFQDRGESLCLVVPLRGFVDPCWAGRVSSVHPRRVRVENAPTLAP